MEKRQGSVSISTENIFPIIKKWLYSEKDIFIREVVSNACDAISKLKKLESVGEAEIPEGNQWRIDVTLDRDEKTISISDNGIGMTSEEVDKYINQIAFSGAKDFIEKYSNKTDDAQIIGHFGLGFYSVFMVSDKVEIDTLSYVKGSEAVHWESASGMDFEISGSAKDTRGTTITLHISEDSEEYLDKYKLEDTLRKYFSFLPVKLYFHYEDPADEKDEDNEDECECGCKDGECHCHDGEDGECHCHDGEDGECHCHDGEDHEDGECKCHCHDKESKSKDILINDKDPLWLKQPSECTEEEYKEFYRNVFHDFNDPLFWIHLNVDYPFNLKGILYFPKLGNQYDSLEGQIKIYYNQVFVADNVKEVLPEFLLLLKGTIDCPDLPLNVSRSFLQNDGYVNKISAHITKKVADKLNGLFNTERENYNKYWDDINPFIKYGCLKDEKFYDKIKNSVIFKLTDDSYMTTSEYKEKYCPEGDNTTVIYTDNTISQAQYIKMLHEAGTDAAILEHPIDLNFMTFMEYKNEGKIKFDRVDSNVSDKMKSDAPSVDISDAIKSVLESTFKSVSGNDSLKVSSESLKSDMPAIILLSEQGRRMQEMAKMYGDRFPGLNMGKEEMTIVLNTASPVVSKLASLPADDVATDEEKDERDLICGQIFDLAMLAHKPMDKDELTKFIERSAKILNRI